ncbi:MAG TPA: glycosyl hydrolase [Spirochaetaceae bacterium]|nr:glycosyl hydrolase [Spirochaetaceae bacterium]
MLQSSSAHELVKAMSLDEKLSMLSGKGFWHTQDIPRLGIKSVMMADGPHGLRKQVDASDHLGLTNSVPATCFPPAVTLASSWDTELAAELGRALGDECRAEGVAILLGPGINIKRSPLCGRNFEYFSEDPFLAGEMAAAFINGVQSRGVGTSLKHFAANNQECHRLVVDAVVDERSLRELYLAAFEAAVKKGRPRTLMCSYNRVNGLHASEQPWLLTELLRDEWGHEGIVISDWGAVNDRVAGLKAGLELEMPGNGGQNDILLRQAITEGRLDEAVVDEAVRRILAIVRRGEAVPEPAYSYDRDAHHKLALKIALSSMVLLKNGGAALPLAPADTVAVIGSFAKEPRYQGAGSSQINPTRLDKAYDELCRLAGSRLPYAPGFALKCDKAAAAEAAAEAERLAAEALAVAKGAAAVLVFAGLPSIKESEGFDREDLRLPEEQVSLIEKLAEQAHAEGAKLIVVLSNGGPLEMPWLDRVDAVLEGYLGGQAGGGAVARLIFGLESPSGKLAESFPRRLEDNPSFPYFPGTPERVEYREGLYVGYRYYDSAGIDPLFAFGHGLSYTSFSYDEPSVDEEGLTVSCRVTNTGDKAGAEIVQLYIHDTESSVYRPEQELKGFVKLSLEPGRSARAEFALDERSFAFYDAAAKAWQATAGAYELRIGASSRDIRLRATMTLAAGRFTSAQTDGGARRAAAAPSLRVAANAALSPYLKAQVAGAYRVSDEAFEALLGRALPKTRGLKPYGWNTTLGQLSGHWLGRLVLRLVTSSFSGGIAASGDEALLAMVTRSVVEMPLRSLVLMGGGKISYRQAGALLDAMNGRPLKALARFLSAKVRLQ